MPRFTPSTDGCRRAEAFAVKAGRFLAVGSTADIKGLVGEGTQTLDAKQMTVVPGFTDCHNHATGTVLLYDVLVGNPYEVEFVTIRSIVDKLRAKAKETAARHLGGGVFLRRHQSERQARAERARSRRGVEGSSGRGAASRRPHVVLQHQGARDGRHHQGHAQSAGRHVRSRRTGRPQRPRHRPRARRVQQGRHARRSSRRSRRCSASAMASRSSRSSSSATD